MAVYHKFRAFFKYLWSGRTIYHIHSPFVYDLIQNVLKDRTRPYAFVEIQGLKKQLLKNKQRIERSGLGAGQSNAVKTTISNFTRTASIPGKYGEMLFRLVKFYQPKVIVELGTGFGFSAAYMAKAAHGIHLITIEGHEPYADVALQNFTQLNLYEITLLRGTIEEKLPEVLDAYPAADLVYMDGNHSYEATLNYFEQLLPHLHEHSILIVDDINWSVGMQNAWQQLKDHSRVKLSIDLYRMGILFFNTDFHEKQHHILYY